MNITRVLALLPLFVGLAHSFSWDFVVGKGKQLVFYQNGTLTHAEDIPGANNIYSVTYDPVHYRVLFADNVVVGEQNTTTLLSGFDISTRKIQTIFTKITDHGPYIKVINNWWIGNMAYDPVTQLLFWMEEFRRIHSLSLNPVSSNKANDGNLLVSMKDDCRDIAVDSCGGFIYWITDNTIERAAFDGSKREVLIDGEVTQGRSLAIDQLAQKMYWTVEIHYNLNSIESADLNGKNRRTFYSIGEERWATSLTVSKDFIYWWSSTQNAILQLPKSQQRGVGSIVYSEASIHCVGCRLTAANYEIKDQLLGIKTCEALKGLILDVEEPHGLICQNYCFEGNCSVSAEGHPKCSCNRGYSGERCEVNVCYMYCLNNGVCSLNEVKKPVCQCTTYYKGDRCDVSICKDYCLQGNCSISAQGQPTCRCNSGYFGERCEVNACHGHCLNNGYCFLNEEDDPVCQCTADYDGERCEVSASRDNCVSAEGQCNCRCSAGNSDERKVNACHQYCLNDGVCSLNEDREPVCQCTGDFEGDRCDVPAFITKLFLYAYKNIPPVTLCKGVKSTCASTVV